MSATPRRTSSGTKWSEADYAAHGYGTIKLRLPLASLEKLTREAAAAGCSRAEYVDSLIRAETKRRRPVSR